MMKEKVDREDIIHEAVTFVNANGDLTVDLRSNIAAESRAKIVYEYLMQFTDDPLVKESIGFLMTREVSHFQMFSGALADIQPNFPPGGLQGDPRFTHVYYNLSNGTSVRGPWNQGEQWTYIHGPYEHVVERRGQIDMNATGTSKYPTKDLAPTTKMESSLPPLLARYRARRHCNPTRRVDRDAVHKQTPV